MKKTLLFLFSALCISVQAQDYFQQEVNYTIDLRLDDQKHEISAFEEIEYHNNSNQSLDTIYFHLWPNAYKHTNTALAKQILQSRQTNFHYAKEKDRGYIDSLDFKVDGKSVQWTYWNGNDDVAVLLLNETIKTGESITISTPFHVKIPKGVYSRLGHMGETYQMTQWYPKPAVFDKEGWHPMYYLSQGEFYSEYGSYDVSISLPKNYIVGATGDLQNEEERLWMDSLAVLGDQKYANLEQENEEEASGVKIVINTQKNSQKNIEVPKSSSEYKTIRFTQKNVHDFAWFADKRFNVLKGEVELPNTGKKVETWALFTNRHEDLWKEAIEYLNDGLYYYSKWNGDYPYSQCTAVDGALTAGGGMEYPNVTVIGSVGSAKSLETVIVHEVGHNWFYGILGSNERRYPWMDEGINSFNEYRYFKTKYPEKYMAPEKISTSTLGKHVGLDYYTHREENYLQYLFNAREGFDQACGHHSEQFTSINYGMMVYTKTALAFEYLQDYLGEELLDKAMHQYFQMWKFKHPQPKDLQEVLENTSGKELSWFFDDLINTNKKIDYKIAKVDGHDGHYHVELKNKGGIPGPTSVSALSGDSILETKWTSDFSEDTDLHFETSNVDRFVIDAQHKIPEIDRKNNTYKTNGLFPKIEPLKLSILWSLENPDKTQIFFHPSFGYNHYDKVFYGINIHNKQLIPRKFRYSFRPAYSSGTGELVGNAKLKYSHYPSSGLFRAIDFSLAYDTYHYNEGLTYNKIAPEIKFHFGKKLGNSPKSYTLSLRSVGINKELPADVLSDYQILDIKFLFRNNLTLRPFSIETNIQHSQEFSKASVTAVFNKKTKKQRNYSLRTFAGVFLKQSDNSEFNFGVNQSSDYMMDLYYFGRSESSGLWSRQHFETDGGFKSPSLGSSNSWLVSSNLEIPLTNRLGIYTDFALYEFEKKVESEIAYGVQIQVIADFVEFYFPIHQSLWDKEESYGENIRFMFNLNIGNAINKLRSSF